VSVYHQTAVLSVSLCVSLSSHCRSVSVTVCQSIIRLSFCQCHCVSVYHHTVVLSVSLCESLSSDCRSVSVIVCQSIITLSFCQCHCVCMSYVHDIHKSNVCTRVCVCMYVCTVYTWARSRISVTLSPPVNRHLVSAVAVFLAAPGRTGVVSDSYDDVRWSLLDWYGDWWGDTDLMSPAELHRRVSVWCVAATSSPAPAISTSSAMTTPGTSSSHATVVFFLFAFPLVTSTLAIFSWGPTRPAVDFTTAA